MEFPVFLKYPNEKHFFKIISKQEFEEVTVVGNHYDLFHLKAEMYLDIIRIADMLKNEEGLFLLSNEQEFEMIKKKSV